MVFRFHRSQHIQPVHICSGFATFEAKLEAQFNSLCMGDVRGTGKLMKYCFDVGNIREIYEPFFKLSTRTHTHTPMCCNMAYRRNFSANCVLLKRNFIHFADYNEYNELSAMLTGKEIQHKK